MDSVQVLRYEDQIAGAAVFFLVLCEEFDVPSRRALEVAGNIINQARHRDATHLDALRLYARGELHKKGLPA